MKTMTCPAWLSKNCQHEMNYGSHLCTAIQSSGDDIVVLVKPSGIASSQPPLRYEGNREEREGGRVDTHGKPANVVAAVNASV